MTWRFDGHVHSRHSKDGKGTVLELATAAQEAGLHGFALTDHDTVAGHADIDAAAQATGMFILPSIEVTSAEGHVLAYNVHEPIPKGLGLERTTQAIESQGGVAVLAHPLRMFSGIGPRGLETRHGEGLVTAVEARNARERPLVQTNTEAILARLDLPMLGGSDAHWVKDIGTAYTRFPHAPKDGRRLIEMIRKGLCEPAGGHLPRRKVWGHSISLPLRKLRRN